MESVKEDDSSEESKKDFKAVRASDQWQTTSCPYGKASEYSDYRLTVKVSDIRLKKSIDLLSEIAFKTILLGVSASLEAKTGLTGFISAYLVFDIIDLARE